MKDRSLSPVAKLFAQSAGTVVQDIGTKRHLVRHEIGCRK
jgi:hypothetical protein